MPAVLDLTAVGVILGRLRPGKDKPLTAKTVSAYLTGSKNGRYADHPFPTPDGYVGRAPYWLAARVPEIEAWAKTRAGQGVGGGRPRKN